MSVIDPALPKWMKQRQADVTEDGAIALFGVFHEDISGGAEVLLRKRSPGPNDDELIEDVAQVLWDAACTDADSRPGGGHERYVVIAYRENDGELEEDSQTSFSIRAGFQRPFGGSTEPPNEKGMVGQQMRLIGDLHKLLADVSHSTNNRLEAENARLQARMQTAEEHQLRMMTMFQELQDRKQERDLERAEAEQKARRMDQFAELALAMAPLLIAKLTGGATAGLLKASGTARDRAVGEILKGLTEEEISNIAEGLTTENQLKFLELYKSYADDLRNTEKEKPSILQDPAVVGDGQTQH